MEVRNRRKCLGQFWCGCSKGSRGGFKKIMDFEQGLVVYQHTSSEVYDKPKTGVKEVPKHSQSLLATADKDIHTDEIETQTDNTVIVIHNTNDSDIFVQSADFLPEFDINTVSCPRCRYIMTRAKKLLASVPVVKKKDIRCVCDLCVLKQQSRTPCHVCQSVIRQFEATGIKNEPIAGNIKKEILTYLTNAKRILRTNIKTEERNVIRSLSQCDITKIVERRDKYSKRLSRPKSSPLLDATVKYVSDQELPNIMLQKKKVTIKRETSVELPKKEHLMKEMYQKEDIDENVRIILKPVLKTITEAKASQQEVPISKREMKTPYRSGDVTKTKKSETILGIGTTGIMRRSHSDDSMITSFTGLREEIFKKNFKYFFPRIIKKEMSVIKKTSADLIKETKDKFRAETDEKQMKKDEIKKKRMLTEREKEKEKEELKRKIELAKQQGIIPLDDNKSYEIDKKTGLLVEKIKRGHISKKGKSLDDKEKEDKIKMLREKREERKEKLGTREEKREERKEKLGAREEKREERKEKLGAREEKREERKEKRGEKDGKQEFTGKRKFQTERENQGVIITVPKIHATKQGMKNIGKQETEKRSKETGVKVDVLQLVGKRKQATGQKVSEIAKSGVKVSDKSGVKVSEIAKSGEKISDKSGVKVSDNALQSKEQQDRKQATSGVKVGDNALQSKEQQDKDKMTDAKVGTSSEVITEDHLVDEREEDHEKGFDKLHLPRKGDLTVDKAKAVLKTKTTSLIKEEGKGKLQKEHVKLLNKVLDKQDQIGSKHHKLQLAQDARLDKFKEMSNKATQLLKDESLSYFDGNFKKEPKEKDKKKGKDKDVTTDKFNLKQIQVQVSVDDLLLKLIKTNKADKTVQKSKPVPPLPTVPRKTYRDKAEQAEEEETISENLELMKEESELVFGTEIIKTKHIPPELEELNQPVLFQNVFNENRAKFERKMSEQKPATSESQGTHGPGAFRYQLSDRTYIDNGWTLLPDEKIIRKMNIYRMRPVRPEFDWFEHNRGKGAMFYDTGEKMADFDHTGHGRWYYKNGRIALDYYDCEESNAQQRFVIYSSGEPDDRGRTQPITVLGMFDYMGNGIVFDHQGKIRLKYNQSEGVVLDRGIGPVSHWKWHSLNDPPELQQVMIDTQLTFKDPGLAALAEMSYKSEPRVDDEEMLAIEFENFIKSKNIKPTEKFHPYQIKLKALKINEQFSLRVLDQKTIYLHYRDGSQIMKLNLGMELDHKDIIDTGSCELGEVTLNMEVQPAVTDSIENLQRSLANAHGVSRVRAERELWLKPPPPGASADKLNAAVSRPLQPTLLPADAHNYKYRISSANNLYYNTRLV